MARTVLVACDSATDDDAPLAFAHTLSRLLGAPVARVTVRADERVAGDEPDLLPSRPRTGVRVIRAASVPAGLQRVLAEEGPELLVLGSATAADLGRTLLGSTAERILQGASRAVAVVPRGYVAGPVRAIGVGLLPTPDGAHALHAAAAIARAAAVPLIALVILRRTPDADDDRALASVREAIDAAGVPIESRVLVGEPGDALLRASARLSLLVLGSRAYGPPGVVLPGGVTRRVLAGARCPVLVLPRAQ
jgi:nucleotide-binding universal stress UspA family protein